MIGVASIEFTNGHTKFFHDVSDESAARKDDNTVTRVLVGSDGVEVRYVCGTYTMFPWAQIVGFTFVPKKADA